MFNNKRLFEIFEMDLETHGGIILAKPIKLRRPLLQSTSQTMIESHELDRQRQHIINLRKQFN